MVTMVTIQENMHQHEGTREMLHPIHTIQHYSQWIVTHQYSEQAGVYQSMVPSRIKHYQ